MTDVPFAAVSGDARARRDGLNDAGGAEAVDFDSEGAARRALLKKYPHGTIQLVDPDGTLINVAQDHH